MLTRWLVIAVVHLWALWMLSPQMLPTATVAHLDGWLPRERLSYDIALGGGTSLLLYVHADEEIGLKMVQDAHRLHGHKQGQTLLVPADAETLAQVALDFPHYRVTGTTLHDDAPHAILSPSLAWVQRTEAGAVHRTQAILQRRLLEQGIEQATLTLEGDHSLRIRTPDLDHFY